MLRHALRRMVPLLSGRVELLPRQQRLLSSTREASLFDSVHMTENCIRRLKELHSTGSSAEGKMLRLGVETGGCSGFQYVFCLDDKTNADDRVFEKDGVKLVVDNVSYDFVKGATVDYVEELIRAAFQSTMKSISFMRETYRWIQYFTKKEKKEISNGLATEGRLCSVFILLYLEFGRLGSQLEINCELSNINTRNGAKKVVTNPSAVGGCSCKSSFMVK